MASRLLPQARPLLLVAAVAIAASDICVRSFSLIGRLSQVMQLTKIISESVKKLPTAPRVLARC
jgi:hypothetical protein